jgi:hypothetical protein
MIIHGPWGGASVALPFCRLFKEKIVKKTKTILQKNNIFIIITQYILPASSRTINKAVSNNIDNNNNNNNNINN